VWSAHAEGPLVGAHHPETALLHASDRDTPLPAPPVIYTLTDAPAESARRNDRRLQRHE